jgi:RHS repeat-associated protein
MKKLLGWAVLSLLVLCNLAEAQVERVTYYYTDPQGTPLAETDANGVITSSLDYRPYGSLAAGSAADGPGYTGHVFDPDTGLVYMQQRYYAPDVGRFLSVDPVAVDPNTGLNFNRYAYARNNTFKFIDPDGRSVTCSENSCTIDSHSILEAVVDHATVSVIYASRLVSNAIANSQSQSQGPTSQSESSDKTSDGVAAPALPKGLVGDSPQATAKNGGTAVGTSLPSGKFADTVKDLTGDTLGKPDSKGRSTSPNGIAVRTGGKSGPRIDVPANGTKPPEIIHFPDDTPIPSTMKLLP